MYKIYRMLPLPRLWRIVRKSERKKRSAVVALAECSHANRTPLGIVRSPENIVSMHYSSNTVLRTSAQDPANEPTIAEDIIIGRTPLVALKTAPLILPAAMLLNASCFPR